jgi:hypothetical protein
MSVPITPGSGVTMAADPLAQTLGYARPSLAGPPSAPGPAGIAGLPTGDFDLGNVTVSQVRTFDALLNTFSKTYSFRYDEAQRQDPAFALQMRREPFLRALEQERLLPLTRWKWQCRPPDPEHPEQAARAKVYEAIIRKTPQLSRQFLYLGQASWYGRYGSQLAFDEKQLDNGETGVCVSKHKPVNGDKIVFDYRDDCPGIMLMPSAAYQFPREDVTYTDRGGMVLMLRRPEYRRKFLLHQHQIEDADYYEPEMAGRVMGIGLRDFAFYGTRLRADLIRWAVAFMEKVGTLGILVFYYPEGNAKAKALAETASREASNRNAIAIPVPKGQDQKTSSVELLPANMTGVQFLVDIIANWWERHLERLWIGQSMSAGGGGSGGLEGDGRAEFAKDTKFNILSFDATILAESYTTDLLPVLEDLNGDPGFGLQFEFMLPDPQAKDKLEAVTKAANLPGKKLTFRADEVRELTGLTKPEEGEEIVGGDEPQPGADPNAPGGAGAGGDPLDALFEEGEETESPAPQATEEAQYRKDSTGHEHKGKGPGGGQFTKGGGSDSGSDTSKKKAATADDKKKPPPRVSPKEHAAVIAKAKAKFKNNPLPSSQELKEARIGLAKLGANKYRKNLVGNSVQRRARREALQCEFGDCKKCPCLYCGTLVGDAIGEGTLEQDKIFTTAQGGRYRLPNLVPSCKGCNSARGDKPFSEFLKSKGL